MTGKKTVANYTFYLLIVAIIILTNVISSFVFHRFDFTDDKRYTLSSVSGDLVADLDDIVYIKVYLEGDLPAGFRRLREETQILLDELRLHCSGKLHYEFIDPSAYDSGEQIKKVQEQLIREGLQPTELYFGEGGKSSKKIIFPGALVSYKGRQLPVQLLKTQLGVNPEQNLNNSVQVLEFEFANAIQSLVKNKKEKIGLIEGHGELLENDVADITRTLLNDFDVSRLRLDGKLNSLRGLRAVVIAKPTKPFTEKDKFIIDQFIMRGGRVLWLIDNTNASMDSLRKNNIAFATSAELNIDDQLFKYGFRIKSNLIQDLQAAPIPIVTGYVGDQPQQTLFPWYFFPLVISSSDHPIVNNLNAIRFEFVSSIDILEKKKSKAVPLLRTSQFSRPLNVPVRVSLSILEHDPEKEQFNKPFQVVAAVAEGSFESLFKNRILPQIENSGEIGFKEVSKTTKMVLIADGDVIRNEVSQSTGNIYPLGYDRFTNETYGNKNLILNAIDYLCNDTGVLTLRSKEVRLRLLNQTKIKEERLQWQLTNAVGPLVLLLLFGFAKNYWRSRLMK